MKNFVQLDVVRSTASVELVTISAVPTIVFLPATISLVVMPQTRALPARGAAQNLASVALALIVGSPL
jgi:hypothetical protein